MSHGRGQEGRCRPSGFQHFLVPLTHVPSGCSQHQSVSGLPTSHFSPGIFTRKGLPAGLSSAAVTTALPWLAEAGLVNPHPRPGRIELPTGGSGGPVKTLTSIYAPPERCPHAQTEQNISSLVLVKAGLSEGEGLLVRGMLHRQPTTSYMTRLLPASCLRLQLWTHLPLPDPQTHGGLLTLFTLLDICCHCTLQGERVGCSVPAKSQGASAAICGLAVLEAGSPR